MGLTTRGAVDGEAGRAGVVAGPGALEAVGDAGAGRDGAVVAGVGEGRVRAGLGEATVEVAGDVLVAGEGEGQRPSVDRGGAGVGDDHLGGEAAGPFAVPGVGDVAGAAAGAAADRPCEAGPPGCPSAISPDYRDGRSPCGAVTFRRQARMAR